MGFDSFNRTPWQRSEREYYDGAREVEKRVEIGLEELVKPPEERNAFELLAKSTPPKRTEKWDSLFKQMGSYFYQSKRLIAPITPIDSLFRQMTVDLSVELRTLVGRYNEGGR